MSQADMSGLQPLALMDSISHGIIVVDHGFVVLAWNNWIEEHSGLRAKDVLGRDMRTVISGRIAQRLLTAVTNALRRGQTTVLSRQLNPQVFPFQPERAPGSHSAIIKPVEVTGGRGGLVQIADESAAATREHLLRKSRKELQILRMRAEIANRSKSQFLAGMSHELRTPLNAILGFSEMMRDGFAGAPGPQWNGYVAHIHDAGAHLLQLINDVLDLSKIEAGRMELDLATISPSSVCDECLVVVGGLASRAGVKLDSDLGQAPPHILAEGRRLRQMLLNLLSNAIKFTPEGGTVLLSAKAISADRWQIQVIDNGIGMTPSELDVAMREYAQVSANDGRHVGTGLGLPITKSITELHGGIFNIESRKGGGTTVTLTLPIGDAPISAQADGPETHHLNGEFGEV